MHLPYTDSEVVICVILEEVGQEEVEDEDAGEDG